MLCSSAARVPAKAGGYFVASDQHSKWGVPSSSAVQGEDVAPVRAGTGMLEQRGALPPALSANFSPSSSSERRKFMPFGFKKGS